MAVKKFAIFWGQSNADRSGDWRGWIARHPELNVDLAGITSGPAAQRTLTMPGTWPGYQTIYLDRFTIPDVRFLTDYNPSPSGYQFYPCRGRIAIVQDQNLFMVPSWNVTPNSAVGTTITRTRTGTTHTVTASVTSLTAQGEPLGGVVNVSPVMANPDPELGEEFTIDLLATATSADASTVTQSVCWHDTTINAPGKLNGLLLKCTYSTASPTNAGQSRVISGVSGPFSTKITVASAFPGIPQAGDKFTIESPTGSFETLAYFLPWCPYEGVEGSSDTFNTTDADMNASTNTFTYVRHGMADGTRIRVVSSGGYGGLAANTDYFVVGRTDNTFQVSATFGGSAVDVSATGGATLTWQWYSTNKYKFTTNGDTDISAGNDTITETGHGMAENTKVTLSSSGAYPAGLAAGSYYAVSVTANTFKVALTCDGTPVDITGTAASVTLTWTRYTPGRFNPYPPGFNHYGDAGIPRLYNALAPVGSGPDAYRGAQRWTRNTSWCAGLASKLGSYYGEEMRCTLVSIGGTSLFPQYGTNFSTTSLGAVGWSSTSQIHWHPGDPNSLFARLKTMLTRSVAAAAEEGHTLQCVGIFGSQGEQDSLIEAWANAYEQNLREFKRQLRNFVKSLGLWSGDAERIPYVHAKITGVAPPNIAGSTNPWTYADTINEAIETLVDEDPWMETFEVDDLYKRTDPTNDVFHYSGDAMATLEDRYLAAWERIKELDGATTSIDVCNMALAHLGDSAKITSLDTAVDTSAQARHCARFYPIALTSLLEQHAWSFTTKRKALVAVDAASAEASTTEWDYAYRVPVDAVDVLAVHPADAPDDFASTGSLTNQDFVVEADTRGRRVIYTNLADAWARYRIDTARTIAWPDAFVQALSWHLASMLAGPIIKGDEGRAESKRCIQMAEHFAAKATTSDSRQRQTRGAQPAVPWLTGR